MRARAEKHSIDSLFALLLFGVFAACLLLVLLMGARSYQGVAAAGGEDREQRLALHYIAAKVRHHSAEQAIWVNQFDHDYPELNTLHLIENIDGVDYSTRIYYYDGYIRELFTESGLEFEPADGQPVLASSGLSFSVSSAVLTVSCTNSEGQARQLHLWLRAAGGEQL